MYRPRFFHFKIRLGHLLHISRKSRMLRGMILFNYHILCMIEYNRCLIIKNKFLYVIESNTFHFYKIIHPRRCAIKCRNRNGSGLQHCIDSGTIAVQCGLSKRIWFNQYQIFQTLLTHNTHKSQKTDPLFKVTGRMLWNLPVTELAYSKQVYTKDIHFQGIVASGNVLQS